MVDILPFVWYNGGMLKMSVLPQKIVLGDVSKMFLPSDITKGPKKIMNFFWDYEGHQKNQESFML
jgi:hypothetical protein